MASQYLDKLWVNVNYEIKSFGDDGCELTLPENHVEESVTSSTAKNVAVPASTPLPDKLDGGSKQGAIIKPFRLMDLPVSIRNNVYCRLLVIPALICVRQKYRSYSDEDRLLQAEHRELLPGVASAYARLSVCGSEFPFACFRRTNAAILRVCREVSVEAKAILYGQNEFEVQCPNLELNPRPDYRVPLFPRGYLRIIQRLNIRIRSLYQLRCLMHSGPSKIKDAYRGLRVLTVIFEMEAAKKGFGRILNKKESELWGPYIDRLRGTLATEVFGQAGCKAIPAWVDLRVVFDGERYNDISTFEYDGTDSSNGTQGHANHDDRNEEEVGRLNLKRGLVEVSIDRFPEIKRHHS